jgi:Na+-driven multidrug efflux pump
MEPLPAYVKILSELFVVVSMLSVALEATHRQIGATLRDFRLMGCALLANLILVPVLRVILSRSSRAACGAIRRPVRGRLRRELKR